MDITIAKKLLFLKKNGMKVLKFYDIEKNINNNLIAEGIYYLKIYKEKDVYISTYFGFEYKKIKNNLVYLKYYFSYLFFMLKINNIDIEKEENLFYINYTTFTLENFKDLRKKYIKIFEKKTKKKFPFSFKKQLFYLQEKFILDYKIILFKIPDNFEEGKFFLINSRELNNIKNKKIKETVKKIEYLLKVPLLIEVSIFNNDIYILNIEEIKFPKKVLIGYYIDMIIEKILDFKDCLKKIDYQDLELLNLKQEKNDKRKLLFLGNGEPVTGELVTGNLIIHPYSNNIKNGIFVRKNISPQDINIIKQCKGLLTLENTVSSHASIIIRGLGKVWISKLQNKVKIYDNYIEVNSIRVYEGEIITLDGKSGDIFKGEKNNVHTVLNKFSIKELSNILKNINKNNPIKTYSKINVLEEINFSENRGSLGIGLLRTEYLMLEFSIRKYLLAYLIERKKEIKNTYLNKFFSIFSNKLKQIFSKFENERINIRLFDFLISEILPISSIEIIELEKLLKIKKEEIVERINFLKEEDSQQGIRGVRFSIFYKIIEKEIEVIFKEFYAIKNKDIELGIIIPMVSTLEEIRYVRSIFNKYETKNTKLGCMIETPRACLITPEIINYVSFLSYGTNDLTQNIFSLSRDNTEKIISEYTKNGIILENPFSSFDLRGVGKIISYSLENKQFKLNITKGICGEQSLKKQDIKFLIKNRFDYISCSNSNLIKNILLIYKCTLEEYKEVKNDRKRN